jgi:serine phosphatase RsbU (regulator of sigma subunit)
MNFDYLNKTWKILVIDDSKLNRAIIRKVLSDLNMDVDEANDGELGLEALERKKYDLVLVDIIMPNLDGFGFLSKFKDTIGKDFIPVVLMTGSDDLKSKIKGLRIGADDFLLKPLNEKELVARVLSLLRLKSVYTELYEKNMLIKKELEMASRLQNFIIPKDFSHIEYPKISGYYLPIEDIGGDYFDCYTINNTNYGFLIADVTGHGIPAALVMTMSKMIFSIYAPRYESTKELISAVNMNIRGLLLDTQYITSFYVIYDSTTKKIRYTNAGHNWALYYQSARKRVVALDTKGYFIGISDDSSYGEKTLSVENGDRLFMYTDGVTEIKNNDSENFGEKRLANFIINNNEKHGNDFCNTLMKELMSFALLENRLDDIAFMNIEF